MGHSAIFRSLHALHFGNMGKPHCLGIIAVYMIYINLKKMSIRMAGKHINIRSIYMLLASTSGMPNGGHGFNFQLVLIFKI